MTANNDALPPLPGPQKECWLGHQLFSADQMRDYARAAIRALSADRGEAVAWRTIVAGEVGPIPGSVWRDLPVSAWAKADAEDGVCRIEYAYAATPPPAAPSEVSDAEIGRALDAQPFATENIGKRVWQFIDHPRAELIIRAALEAAQPQPGRMEGMVRTLYEAAGKGFHVSETCGPDGKYWHISKFQSLADLQAYEQAWREVMLAAKKETP